MKFAFSANPNPQADGLTILCPPGDYADLRAPLIDYDNTLEEHLSRRIKEQSFRGKKGQRVTLDTLGKLPFTQLTLLGTGKATTATHWLRLGERLGEAASKRRQKHLAVLPLDRTRASAHLEALARGVLLGGYRFDRYKAKSENDPDPVDLAEITWIGPTVVDLDRVGPLAEGVAFARDLVNEPAGAMTPTALAQAARGLVNEHLTCEILDEAACKKLGMGLFLAVSRGSVEPALLIHLTYTPANPDPSLPKVALVGKGITFDSGGLSLKPTSSMKDMKCDMAGGAAVLGTMGLLAQYDVRCVVHGIVPACENMPGGRAYRLGDVIRGMDGPSVEVINTDAEGRLALADGISYARSLGCDRIVDLATLTGACLVALGPEIAGLLGSPQSLCDALLNAATAAGESVWQLPLEEGLNDMLKSSVADCKNAGARWGGTITAALFLKKFAQDTDWVHLDIAGPAYLEKPKPGRPAGGTGFGIPTLLQWLCDLEGDE